MLSRIIAPLLIGFFTLAAQAEAINWQPWKAETFARARAESRMIFVDVGIEGCTACRRMSEISFEDPAVQKLLNEYFIAISIDAEARPDLGERYSDWAWPALIFMAPDTTQVLALRGNRIPSNFIPILNELISKQAAGKLLADELAPYAVPPNPVTSELSKLRDSLRAQLDGQLDEERGGWSGRSLSTLSGGRIDHLLFRAHLYGNKELEALGLKTAESLLLTLDPVWGGVFEAYIYSRDLNIPEKRISSQASTMMAFASAWQLTGDERYRDAIREIHRYVANWMTADNGGFYTSQEDEPIGLAIDTQAYWNLPSDEQRRKHGIPPIDHAVYSDKNGEMIRAYVRAYEATKEQDYLNAAIKAANSLIKNRMTPAGWIQQAMANKRLAQDQRMREHYREQRPYLSAQASFGSALLALYTTTGEKHWLKKADRMAGAMLTLLEDKNHGGFYATALDGTEGLISPRKPLEWNSRAAHFFYDLWVLSKKAAYEQIPERTLRAVAVPSVVEREGKITAETGLALEKLVAAYVEFSVVGDPQEPLAQALFDAGRSTYHPRKLVHYEAPGRYPKRAKAAMYICNPDVCSLPIENPSDVAAQAAALSR